MINFFAKKEEKLTVNIEGDKQDDEPLYNPLLKELFLTKHTEQ
jgi:hypothetical protein